jgi:N-acetylglucosaminyldiphosphoundecaprenol N-acetyl-beta-D-mannosaminyltransferase
VSHPVPLRIDAGSADDVWRVIGSAGRRSRSSYVCFANTHLVVEAYRDRAVLDALNGSLLTLPDGAPVAALAGVHRMTGSEAFELVCSKGHAHRYRHFFVGTTAAHLAQFVSAVRVRFPDLEVVGAIAPPFGQALFDSLDETIGRVAEVEPDFIWVGLGAPKQELWMAEAVKKLPQGVMLGVGAVFDFTSGRIPRAPRLLRAIGQEWLFRLAVEPRRLWRRYLMTALGLVALLVLSAVNRRRPVDRRPIA